MNDMKENRPELLAPAGDMERLQAALDFGADAVYLAGQMFGMRTAPSNFTREQLQEMCIRDSSNTDATSLGLKSGRLTIARILHDGTSVTTTAPFFRCFLAACSATF